MASTFIAIVGIALFALFLIAINISALLYICQPNEILILSGRSRKASSGKTVGYRLIHGGRAIRMPLIERAHKMDLTNMIIDIQVQGAYSKGGIPLDISGMANIKIASSEPIIFNAIERFLGRSREDIKTIAKDTLEGNLRGVLATLTPEEVNQDRIKFAQKLLEEADHDLSHIGIVLDTLKIQNISDDKGYLDSLGRKESARLLRDARIAEADNAALSKIASAENLQAKEIAKLQARVQEAQADMHRRVKESETRQEALAAEERGEVMALVAKAEAELKFQAERVQQVRLQLEADKLQKAKARRDQQISLAKGEAASIIQNGAALAEAITELAAMWEKSGDNAFQIFMAQKMDNIIPIISKGMGKLQVSKLNVYDKEMLGADSNLMGKSAVYADHFKKLVGSDLGKIFNKS